MTTTDLYPELTPLERQVAFLEQIHGNLSQDKYFELLKIHFEKETKPLKKKVKEVNNQSIINKLKQLWNQNLVLWV